MAKAAFWTKAQSLVLFPQSLIVKKCPEKNLSLHCDEKRVWLTMFAQKYISRVEAGYKSKQMKPYQSDFAVTDCLVTLLT